MNVTNMVPALRVKEEAGDKERAIQFILNRFKNVLYDEYCDIFTYNGYSFDYFRCGTSLNKSDSSLSPTFGLVDILDINLWILFDNEESWNRFYLKTKQHARK